MTVDNRVISAGLLVAGLWWLSGHDAPRKQAARGFMVHRRTEANGYVITTNRDQGYWTSYFVDNNGKHIASKPTKNQTEALQNQDDLSYIAVDLPPAKLGVNPIDKDEVAYLRQQVAKTHELVERAKRQITEARNAMDARDSALPGGRRPVVQKASPELLRAIDNLKNFDYSRIHFERELSLALQRNPVMRAKSLDKAEEKVRKLADAARGSMASPQSKAAYRRALDELMQVRIDAGTQATLFDVAPRQTTQRGLPGLFDNPISEDRERQYAIADSIVEKLEDAMRDLPRVGTPKRLQTAQETVAWKAGTTVAKIPRWTMAQVEAQRKALIRTALRDAGVKGTDDLHQIGGIIDRQFRMHW